MGPRYPDTWLRGLRLEAALGVWLLFICVTDAARRDWWWFWFVAVALAFSTTINVLFWRMRGKVIRAEKGSKMAPVSFGGGAVPIGGGPQISSTSGALSVAYTSAPTMPAPSVVITGDRLARHKDYPNTFGWRAWRWDVQRKLLRSPQQGTPWHGSELRVESWEEQAVVRGRAGIHAEFVPEGWEARVSDYAQEVMNPLIFPTPAQMGSTFIRMTICGVHFHLNAVGNDWRDASTGKVYQSGVPIMLQGGDCAVHGIVERFGKFVMGTEGWRAEWVVIRKLLAPDTEIGLALEQAYPDVEVIYPKEKPDGYR